MARDPRLKVSVYFSEEQTQWIEAQVDADKAPDKNAVIRSAIDLAMKAAAAPEVSHPVADVNVRRPAFSPSPCSFTPKKLAEMSYTLDILLQKYMIDHPGGDLSPTEHRDLLTRWDAIVALRTRDEID